MSRHLINGDVGAFYSNMDVMTIDGSRLQIPASGVRGKPRSRGNEIRLVSSHDHRDPSRETRHCDTIAEPATPMLGFTGPSGSQRNDIVIDVRPRSDGKTNVEVQALLETNSFAVPLGYFLFWLALVLCNLLRPALTHAVCIALSPLPMLCILAHAVGIQPVWIGWGLMICGWMTPSVCALWSVQYSVCYLVSLIVFAVAGCRRVIPALCLGLVTLCSILALNQQWTGLEPKIWMTVAAFFTALACATAYTGGGKIIYRIKSTL